MKRLPDPGGVCGEVAGQAGAPVLWSRSREQLTGLFALGEVRAPHNQEEKKALRRVLLMFPVMSGAGPERGVRVPAPSAVARAWRSPRGCRGHFLNT